MRSGYSQRYGAARFANTGGTAFHEDRAAHDMTISNQHVAGWRREIFELERRAELNQRVYAIRPVQGSERDYTALQFVEHAERIFSLQFHRATDRNLGCADRLAENVFVANDLDIIAHVRSRRDESAQVRDEMRAAYAFEQLSVAQRISDRDEINRFLGVVHVAQHGVDRPVRRDVKVLLAESLFDALGDCLVW